jgi:hypothetical protein
MLCIEKLWFLRLGIDGIEGKRSLFAFEILFYISDLVAEEYKEIIP